MTLHSGRWQTPDKKSLSAHIHAPPSEPGGQLWWAHAEGKSMTLVCPAIQYVDCSDSKDLIRIFNQDARVIGAKPGLAVLRAVVDSTERWFGPVKLELKDKDIDPHVTDELVTEISPSGTPVASGRRRFLPPDWSPGEPIGALAPEGEQTFYERFAQLLQPQVLKQIADIQKRSAADLTRLQIDADALTHLPDNFVDSLLRIPCVAKRNSLMSQKARVEADSIVAEAKKERDRVQADIDALLLTKTEAIRGALESIQEDDRALAIISALGLRPSPSPVIDLSGIEGIMSEYSKRPQTPGTDVDPIVSAIQSREKIDFAPIVEALNLLAPKQPQSDAPSSLISVLKAQGKETLTSSKEIGEAISNESHRALIIAAHSGLVGLVTGERSPETVQQVLRVLVAGRALWWPVPSDLVDVRKLLEDRDVGLIFDHALGRPDQLCALVLEGVDRAPTEAYLEPLLVIRALGTPVLKAPHGWPKNLLVFATASRGGKTLLPISPGTWERVILIPSSSERQRVTSEIAQPFWMETSRSAPAIDLTDLLPTGIKPRDADNLARSAAHLGFDVPECLTHGLAAAICLSHQESVRPRGG
ncbi:MAG: hypothetical protein JNM34_11670, partial [Chthonomonadaceae bacterium]|nr:hypothetical protein [Chthonomonadaceae bacterium]